MSFFLIRRSMEIYSLNIDFFRSYDRITYV